MFCLHSAAFFITPIPAQYAVGREGEDITISCIPDVTLTIQWIKDSLPIYADKSKYILSPSDKNYTLTIKNVSKSDGGMYTCLPPAAFNVTIQVIIINGMYFCVFILHFNKHVHSICDWILENQPICHI